MCDRRVWKGRAGAATVLSRPRTGRAREQGRRGPPAPAGPRPLSWGPFSYKHPGPSGPVAAPVTRGQSVSASRLRPRLRAGAGVTCDFCHVRAWY